MPSMLFAPHVPHVRCPFCRSLTTKIMDKKRSPNRLIVDEATNDDNSVSQQCRPGKGA